MASSNHIVRITRSALAQDSVSEGDYREFSENDGLAATEGVRRDRSMITDAKGRVWISTIGGLSVTHKMTQHAETVFPHIESVLSDDKHVDPYGVATIRPNPQRITISYQAVSLAVPNRVRYRYKLQGFDHAWSEPTDSRQVVYTNLGPGLYQFALQVSQGDDWKGPDTILSFSIQPTLWQTWWFRLFSAIVVCILLAVVYRLRIHSIARAMSKQFDTRLDERTRMARELHDTFLQTVQGSKMVADDALATATDETRLRFILEKLSTWLGQAVTEGRAALHALRVSTTEQNELAEFLEQTLKEQCRDSSISIALSVIGDPRALHPIVRDEISLIAKEAIRNASLHSKASQLSVELQYAEDLSFYCKDDGIGIDPHILSEGKTKHFGLQGMRERSVRIRAKIAISSPQNCGTEIILKVPGTFAYRHDKTPLTERFISRVMGERSIKSK